MAGKERPLRAVDRPVPRDRPPSRTGGGGTGGGGKSGGGKSGGGKSGGPRRRRRLLLWGALALLLVPLGLLGLLLAGLQTQAGRDLLRDIVVAQVSGPDLSLRIGRLGGAPPGLLVIEQLSVADPEGVWLESDRLVLDWSPLALLGGTLRVAEIEAGRIRLARLPAGDEDTEPEPGRAFELPTLPLAVELERLHVEDLELAEPVLGEPLALSIEGALAAERQGTVESRLKVAERSGDGALEATATYRLADRHLAVALQADAPADGRVARVSGLPGAPAIAFRLDGKGPLPGWRADWRADASPVLAGEGQLGLESLQPLSLLLAGRIEPGSDFPPDAAPWVAPALVFDVALDYDPGAETAQLRIRELSSRALAATGQADAALAEDTADARLALSLRDPAPLQALAPGLDLQGAELEIVAEKRSRQARLTLQGLLRQPYLAAALPPDGPAPASAGAGDIGFESVELDLDSGALDLEDLFSGGDPARLSLTATGPRGDPALALALDRTTTLEVSAVPTEDAVEIKSLALASGPLTLSGSGRYDMAGEDAGAGAFDVTLQQDDLSRLSDLAGTELGGRLTVALDGRLQSDGAAEARLTATPADLRLGIPAAEALLGPRPILTVEAARGGDGRLSLREATLTATPAETHGAGDEPGDEIVPLRLTVHGTLGQDGEALEASASLALPRLAVLQSADLPLSGEATLDISVFGSLAAPQAVWSLRGERLGYQDRRVENLEVDGTTTGLPERPSGRVDLTAATPAGAVRGGFDYAVGETTARLENLELARGRDRLAGTIETHLADGTAEGALTLVLRDLADYGAILGQDLAGAAELSVTLSSAEGQQQARLVASAHDLRLAELALARLDLQAEGRDLLGEPRLQASLDGQGLEAPDLQLTRLAVEAQGDLGQLAVEASLDGEALRHPLTVSTSAELGLEAATRIRLTALDARLGDEILTLSGPAEILLDGERTRVRDLALAVAEGRLSLEADLQPGSIALDLQATGLPVRLARLADPALDPRGTLDLAMALSGAPPRPDGTLTLVARGLQLGAGADHTVPPLELRLDGRLSGGRLSADGRLSGFAASPLTLAVGLPLRVSATPPSVSLPQDEPLSLEADWEGRLEQLMAVLPIDAVRFGGAGRIDLGVTGTLADPMATGGVSVEEGFYENYTLAMQLEPVTLRLSGQGRRLELESFAARDGEGGSMQAQGFIDLSGGAPRFDLTFTADNAHVVRRDDVNGSLDADLSLEGSTEGASLSGRLRTRPTEVRLIDALPPSVTELEVVEVNDATPPPVEETEEEAGEPPGVDGLSWLALAVEVDIPGQVFVRGRGLDSEWRGSLQIGGTAQRPRIQGQLAPVRGSFDFAGRVFELSPESSIQFLGGATIDPELDLTATYRSSDLIASVVVFGAVSDPQIELTSSPPLPEDEILSRVLFGKSSGQLTAGEAVQLAQAAETLQGGGGEGLLGIARRTLGVDVLSFAPGETGDDVGSLRIGKYVSENVFIGAQQGTTAGSSSAIVEWELTPNITVESEVGADNRSNATINWKWDY